MPQLSPSRNILGDPLENKEDEPEAQEKTSPEMILPVLLRKLVGEFFLIFRREIWKI